MTDREFVRSFINDFCIARVEPGSKELPAYGGRGYYTWQFYLRQALFDPRILDIIVKDFLSRYEQPIKAGDMQLCGVESSSTPLLTGIAIACRARGYDANVFSIRKEQKAYGKRNWIEGSVIPNITIPAMMVDDIISPTHKTAIHGATILKQEGILMAPHVYALVHKTIKPAYPFSPADRITLSGQTVVVGSMFCLNDFDLELKTYRERKHND